MRSKGQEMTLSFKVSGLNSSKKLVQHKNQSYFLSYPCEAASSSSCVPYESTFPAGEYFVQCYGGSGANSASASGGKGGFSQGVLSLKQRTKVFIFIGGKGSLSNTNYQNSPGGFNGGGIGGFDPYQVVFSGSGGGATDIRINSNNYHNRVIVAGGGGGGGGAAYAISQYFGGDGGGFQGGGSNDYETGKGATGATQENGGIAYTARGATSGSLGVGGRGSSNYYAHPGGGGGGGYYGGGGGSSSADHSSGWSAGGSGGSGFIGGVEKGETFSGSSQYGHVGNGYSIITILSQQSLQLKSKLLISFHLCYFCIPIIS